MEENHILRPSSVFGKSVSTAVQYSGFIDCRKFSWQQMHWLPSARREISSF